MKKLFTLITLASAVDLFAASQSNEMDISHRTDHVGRSSSGASSDMETALAALSASPISAGRTSSRTSSSMNPAVTAADLDAAFPLAPLGSVGNMDSLLLSDLDTSADSSPLDTAFCMASSEIVRVVPSYASGAGQKRGHLPKVISSEPSDSEHASPASKKFRIAKAKLNAATSYTSGAGQKRGHLPKVKGFKYTGRSAKRSRVEAVPVELSAVASMGVGAKRARPASVITRPTILNSKKVGSPGQGKSKRSRIDAATDDASA